MYNRPHSVRNLKARESERDPLLGTWIGNYELISQIGQGGMGIVYLAQHPVIRKKVAIKVLREEVAHRADVVHRFRAEARAISQISHPNVVEVTDFGETPGGQFYFVMEYLEGRSLGEVLQQEKSPFPILRGVRVLAQVARGLSAAHAQGVIHRDLKPDNIFLLRQTQPDHPEEVKILDFGIAKLADLSGGRGGTPRVKTDWSTVLGTPAYMSPEQASGEEIDARSDLYSLGIIAYEMFVGDVPFKADTLGRLIYKHIHELPVPPSKKNREISQPLEDLILRCLEKRVERRPASAADVARALEGLLLDSEEAKTNVQILISNADTPPPMSALHPSTARSASLEQGAFFEEDDLSREERGEPTRIAPSSRHNGGSPKDPQTKLSRPVTQKESSRQWATPTKPPLQEDDDTTAIAPSNQKDILERIEQFRAKSSYAATPSEPLSSPAIVPIPPLTWDDISSDASRQPGNEPSFLAAIPAGLDESGSWEDTSIREDSDPGWAQIPTRIAQASSGYQQAASQNLLSNLDPAQRAALANLAGEKTLPPRDAPDPSSKAPHDDLSSASWDAIPTSIAQIPQETSSLSEPEPPVEVLKTLPESQLASFRAKASPASNAAQEDTDGVEPETQARIETEFATATPARVPPSPTAILEETQIPDRQRPSLRSARVAEAPAVTEAPVWGQPRPSVKKAQNLTQIDVDSLPSPPPPSKQTPAPPSKQSPASVGAAPASPASQKSPPPAGPPSAPKVSPPAPRAVERRPTPPSPKLPSPPARPAGNPGLDSKLEPSSKISDPLPSISLSMVKSAQAAPTPIADNATRAASARNKLILFALLAGALLATVLVVLIVPFLKSTDEDTPKVLPQIAPERSTPQLAVQDTPPASQEISSPAATTPPAPKTEEIPVYVDKDPKCADDFEVFVAGAEESLGISTVAQPLLIPLTAPRYTFKKGGYISQERSLEELKQKKAICLEVIDPLPTLDPVTPPEEPKPEVTKPVEPKPIKTVKKTPVKTVKKTNTPPPKKTNKTPPKKNKFSLD